MFSVASAYYTYMVTNDYLVVSQIPCTPGEQCFAPQCDQEECTDEYFKENAYIILETNASTMSCNSQETGCMNRLCSDHPHSCSKISCVPSDVNTCISF